uniref:Uncharacterized protein n=1 Tax=Opuntia streptacantha TaxID=393608 RepID=A0A7C8YCN8_OPUST
MRFCAGGRGSSFIPQFQLDPRLKIVDCKLLRWESRGWFKKILTSIQITQENNIKHLSTKSNVIKQEGTFGKQDKQMKIYFLMPRLWRCIMLVAHASNAHGET